MSRPADWRCTCRRCNGTCIIRPRTFGSISAPFDYDDCSCIDDHRNDAYADAPVDWDREVDAMVARFEGADS